MAENDLKHMNYLQVLMCSNLDKISIQKTITGLF